MITLWYYHLHLPTWPNKIFQNQNLHLPTVNSLSRRSTPASRSILAAGASRKRCERPWNQPCQCGSLAARSTLHVRCWLGGSVVLGPAMSPSAPSPSSSWMQSPASALSTLSTFSPLPFSSPSSSLGILAATRTPDWSHTWPGMDTRADSWFRTWETWKICKTLFVDKTNSLNAHG